MKKLLVLTALFPFLSFAQMTELEVRKIANSGKESELVQLSSQMLQQNYLFHAEIIVDKLILLQPENSNYNYRKGYIALNSRNDYEVGIKHLENAVKSVNKNYDMYSAREKTAPIDAYYFLGKCYHLNEQLDEAKKYYNLFIQNSAKASQNLAPARLGLAQCDVAKQEISNPKSAIVKNIGSRVNGANPDYAPVISLDGNSLYFTSRRGWDDGSTEEFRDPLLNQYPEDIFVSYTDFDGEWTSPEKLAFCDNELNEATISISSDERRVFVYQDATGGGDIYYSDFEENQFDNLSKLRYNEVNTEYWETHCTMTPDGQNMYFVSDRPGGFGGRDIYRIVRLPNGEWSKAQNMGPTINTLYDEDSPFIAINNKTLYYSSNGESSMGGFDIFVTFRDDNNAWSTPTNMGYPINSTGDDIFYTTTVDGLRGYLSSFRKNGYGEKDIYEVQNDYLGNYPVSSLRGNFISLDGRPVPDNIAVKIICTNCDFDADKEISPRIKAESAFFAVLNRCKDYRIEYFEGDQLLSSENFVTLCNNVNEKITKVKYLGHILMTGTVSDDKSFEFIKGSKVELLDPETQDVIETLMTDANGTFTSNLLEGKIPGDRASFDVRVSKDGYLTQTFKVDTLLEGYITLELPYMLSKSEVGTDIGELLHLNPIYFDLDKSNIRPDAALELEKIIRIMNENPDMRIELGSHTDCRASKSYNLSLSNRRARSSAKYIKARISNPKRIYGKGYGESQLVNNCGCEGSVVSDCSEEEHQANRRTEFKIVEKK